MKVLSDKHLSGDGNPHPIYIQAVEQFAARARRGQLEVRVAAPVTGSLDRPSQSGVVHHEPELFLQIQGATDFQTPSDSFRLMPGQACIMPPLTPHRERSLRWAGLCFVNIVVMFDRDDLHFHLGLAGASRQPYGARARDYSGERLADIRRCLHEVCAATASDEAGSPDRVQGGMLLALGYLRDSLDLLPGRSNHEHPKVAACRHVATTHLSDPDLNVQELARRVGCSADYLSNLFHREAGTTLTSWLNAQRLDRVRQLLRDSSMNISEIAWATGYRDPGYMARRFRRATGRSPRDYRRAHAEGLDTST